MNFLIFFVFAAFACIAYAKNFATEEEHCRNFVDDKVEFCGLNTEKRERIVYKNRCVFEVAHMNNRE
jgi:hypothetical protein